MPEDSLRGPPWPQRKDSGTPPAFDIGPATAEEQTKADCHIHKGGEQRSTALQRSPLPFTRKGEDDELSSVEKQDEESGTTDAEARTKSKGTPLYQMAEHQIF